jgi:AraC-like DNA-binding protein
MTNDFRFLYSAQALILAIPIAEILVLALALARASTNVAANRSLALVLIIVANILAPINTPFVISFALGPLIWFYATGLVYGHWPSRSWLHLLPAAFQFAVQVLGFLPSAALGASLSGFIGRYQRPIATLGTLVGLFVYCFASLRLLRTYRKFLSQERSDDERFATHWLTQALWAAIALLCVRAGYQGVSLFRALDYKDVFVPFVAIAALGLYLGVEGWRHAELPFPPMAPAVPPPPMRNRDWKAEGEAWAARTRTGRWYLDPALTLAGLARHLGTNTTYLSRAFNEGLGLSFSAFINKLRAEEVAKQLRSGDRRALLEVAFSAGFSSKASFNRAFRAAFDVTASEYRRRQESKPTD